MTASKIMVIRHAEKPDDAGTVFGVTIQGIQDPDELIVRGWQRAGALATFFAPPDAHFRDQRIEKPRTIFASHVAQHSKSLRPQHTVGPLAELIGREKLRLRSRRTLAFARWWGPELFVFLGWRDRLFIFLSNLALDATEFFRIPANRVVELGGQIEI